MNFYIGKNEELTADKIKRIISAHEGYNKPVLRKYYDYYLGKQEILKKRYADPSKPCNRLVKNYCKSITENYLGYIVGIPVSYQSQNNIEEIIDILNYNDVAQTDTHLLKNALIYGVAYETYWIDEEGQQRFKVLDSLECIPVYDDTICSDLQYMIRYYPKPTWDPTAIRQYIIEVADAYEISTYLSDDLFTITQLIDKRPHFFKQVPYTEFKLNEDKLSIFDSIMSLQDGYNELISAEVDDYASFVDAYLCLYGVGIDEDDVAKMRENRILQMNQDDKAEFLIKDVNDAQIQNMLVDFDKAIHTISNSPDFTDQSFGTSSGIALKLKLIGFENTSSSIASNMKKALQRRIELFTEILAIKGVEQVWRDIDIVFKRNLPTDRTEEANYINTMRGLVSDETLLAQLDFVDDPVEELAKRNAERDANLDLYAIVREDQDDEQE